MIYPNPPKPGDTILLVAPSSPLKPSETVTVETITAGLQRMGFKVREGASVRTHTRRGYAAADPQLRADDLNRGFADDSIAAIWPVRGGSTAAQVVPLLDYEMIRRHPKPLMGFSDITALHMALHEKAGLATFHAPNASIAINWDDADYSCRSLKKVLFMEKSCEFENVPGRPIRVYRPGEARGTLVGGNLSLVSEAVGTPYGLDTRGKVLFLEDIGENVYRLELMLTQIKHAGMFDRAVGVLLGDFTDCHNEYSDTYTAEELLDDFFADFPIPVYRGLTAGHIDDNGALPLGTMCAMRDGRIFFEKV